MRTKSRATVRRAVLMLQTATAAALVAGCAGAAWAQPGRASSDARGTVLAGTTGGVVGGGSYAISADAYNSRFGRLDSDLRVDAYRPPPMVASTRTCRERGLFFTATSEAWINTWTDRLLGIPIGTGWGTDLSYANVTPSGVVGLGESAYAESRVSDPNFYGVGPQDQSTRFCVAFEAGLSIAAPSDPAMPYLVGSASISGVTETDHWSDLTMTQPLGELYRYSWSTSTNDPAGFRFEFTSNPMLGLDDSAIVGQFTNAVQFDPVNGFSLAAPIVIWSAPIPANPGYVYELGGETRYHADAVIPSAGTVTILTLAGLLTVRRRRT